MEKKLFLFSTESRHGVGGNLSSLIEHLHISDHSIRLIGAASGYENGNQKLALAKNIDFHLFDPGEEKIEYENIFKKNIHTHFLFWDWHLIIPPELLRKYPIFLLSPGPIEISRQFSGPQIYTQAWKIANNGGPLFIGLYNLQREGKKLWRKNIKFSPGDARKAINARMHHHMRYSLTEILEKIFE
jgi:hypothetical protein